LSCEAVSIQPPIEQWQTLLTEFLEYSQNSAGVIDSRKELLKLAFEYTGQINQAEKRLGLDTERIVQPPKHDTPIVMSGHQPEIFHPGILRKNRELLSFARTNQITPLFVSLDLDQHDAGVFFYPTRNRSGDLTVSKVSLSTGKGLVAGQKVRETGELKEIFSLVESSLHQVAINPSGKFARAKALYMELAGESINLANAIVRRQLAVEHALLEISFSRILEADFAKEWIGSLLSDPEKLFSCFNQSLLSYRADHKIKNTANPFPNLKKDGTRLELPFWVITPVANSRDSLWAALDDGNLSFSYGADSTRIALKSIEKEQIIAPRGALTTALFRHYCCDLFIHGLGGGKYDRFTDQFYANLRQEKLSPFVVVSETRLLFPDLAKELKDTEESSKLIHQIKSHVGDYLDSGYFSVEQKELLTQLAKQQEELIDQLKTSSGKERSTIAHALNGVKAEIAEHVELSIGNSLQTKRSELERQSKAILCREYPFFFFEKL